MFFSKDSAMRRGLNILMMLCGIFFYSCNEAGAENLGDFSTEHHKENAITPDVKMVSVKGGKY